MTINWEELFKQDGLVFHCETEELANELLKIAHGLGYTWSGGDSYLIKNHWYMHRDDTCYDIYNGKIASIGYETRSGSEIINLNDLIKGNRRQFKLYRK